MKTRAVRVDYAVLQHPKYLEKEVLLRVLTKRCNQVGNSNFKTAQFSETCKPCNRKKKSDHFSWGESQEGGYSSFSSVDFC